MKTEITLKEVLAKLLARFDQVDQRFDQIDCSLTGLGDTVNQHSEELKVINSRLSNLESKVDENHNDIKIMIRGLDARVTCLEIWRNSYNP